MRLKKPLALALAGGVSGGDRQYFQGDGGGHSFSAELPEHRGGRRLDVDFAATEPDTF